ncbi:hypothetical protein [Pseudanabaena phage PA-SR01]|nr:hypothetical protein [Pseudanabaena phage PA-SR01]
MADTIKPHKKGDTWDGVEFHFETENNGIYSDMNLTGYSFSAKFKTSPQGSVLWEFSTANGLITCPTPTNGKIYFMPQVINYKPQRYIFGIEMVAPDGRVTTITDGANPLVWTILPDIT